jgi:hypothetical protein
VRRFNSFEKVVITMLAAFAWSGAWFAIAFAALAVCVSTFYAHPGSMAGFWAFMNALFAGAAGFAAGIAWAVIRVWRGDPRRL